MKTWKLLSMLTLALCLLLTTALAADLTPGVTVVADPESPTGYTATFVYESADAKSVALTGTFAFCQSGEAYGALPENVFSAFEWKPGMFRASMSDFAATEAMTKVEGTNYWTVSLPLPSGHYLYNYQVDDVRVPDPINPPMASTAKSGNASRLSTVNVPYDPIQGTSIDFSFMMPRTDDKVGQIAYADYTDVNGNLAPLAIYLPYGYDANRAEAYKVLYLSHGGGGNEMEWFASGNVNHVFDTLIADGEVEPMLVVTMCNTTYQWDYPVINDNMLNHVIPYMEANYNIVKEPMGRAFAGLSMGGATTTNLYKAHADQFGYFGVFSGSFTVELDPADVERLSFPTIMTGNGYYDPASEDSLMAELRDLKIPFKEYLVNGGHDWTTWPPLVKIFATKFLWK